MIKVAFQGEVGAYSEDAAIKFFNGNVDTVYCRTISDVFNKVRNGVFGIVPVENSLGGSIGSVLDAFETCSAKICGEVIVKIEHCLISHKETKITLIKNVYSHPQALLQCRNFLEKHKFNIVPEYDTAGSVSIIKSKNLHYSAAIASRRAAEIYKMKILKKGLSSENNYTRFLILSTEDSKITGDDKTSILMEIPHISGSLYKSFAPFAELGINITKVDSRPINKDWKNKNWEYYFFIDFQGHRNEKKVKDVLVNLRKHAKFVKILGSYPRCKNVF